MEPTTTTLSEEDLAALQLEEDSKLIRQLWRDFSDSWVGGVDAALAFMADNSYRERGCTAEDYRNVADPLEGDRTEVVVHADTIELDSDWLDPTSGPTPQGRIYIMQATVTNPFGSSTLSEIHTTILDGSAYLFIECRDP